MHSCRRYTASSLGDERLNHNNGFRCAVVAREHR
jgi:hypothetical protein